LGRSFLGGSRVGDESRGSSGLASRGSLLDLAIRHRGSGRSGSGSRGGLGRLGLVGRGGGLGWLLGRLLGGLVTAELLLEDGLELVLEVIKSGGSWRHRSVLCGVHMTRE
jgi:hypothetical protein